MPNLSTTDILKLFAKQDGKCPYCGDDLCSLVLSGEKLEIDHKIPSSAGGVSKFKNYVLACQDCNRMKRTKSVEEFMEYIKPYREGIVCRQDIYLYNNYLQLHKKFGHIVNKEGVIQADKAITLAEYIEIQCRFEELEETIQEIYDRLEQSGISKHHLEGGAL
jgi:hypothetical protein